MDINGGLDPVFITAEAFVLGPAVGVGVLGPVLTTLTVMEQSVAYDGGSSNFENDPTFSQNVRQSPSVEAKVMSPDEPVGQSCS